jgi:hypothetical protein
MNDPGSEAKRHLSEVRRGLGEQPEPPPPAERAVRFGAARGKIELKPGWDQPIDIDRFLAGEL